MGDLVYATPRADLVVAFVELLRHHATRALKTKQGVIVTEKEGWVTYKGSTRRYSCDDIGLEGVLLDGDRDAFDDDYDAEVETMDLVARETLSLLQKRKCDALVFWLPKAWCRREVEGRGVFGGLNLLSGRTDKIVVGQWTAVDRCMQMTSCWMESVVQWREKENCSDIFRTRFFVGAI